MAASALLTTLSTPHADAQSSSFTCSEVVGFSQTQQWYFGGPFPQYAGPGRWQLRWEGGASISNWADPNYSGWGPQYLATGCNQGSGNPDRVLINISDDYNTDVNWWKQQISAVITNIRNKYPSERQIIMQAVVGGPNGGQCTNGGQTVRASFNNPYIKQAIDQLVGAEVVAGANPYVSSCGDYADWIGHLTDQAKGPIGVSLGQYYANFGGSGGPTMTPAPTSPPPSPAPPTGTAAPTATLPPGAQAVSFDDLANPNRPLNGQYPNGLIDWGTNAWYLSGPFGQFRNNSIGFNGAGPTGASFAFLSPHRLVQLDAYNGGSSASTISLSCDGTLATEVTLSPGELQSIPMGWIGNCTTVTVGSTNRWNTNFDNLVVDFLAPTATQTPSPTATRTPNPTNTSTPNSTSTPPPGANTATASRTTGVGPQQSQSVTFDDLANPGRPLTGQYPTGLIDWGPNAWYLSGPWRGFATNSVGFNGSGPTSASFTFASPHRLLRLDAYNGGIATTTISASCDGASTTQATVPQGTLGTLATGWSSNCTSVTIGSTNGWETNFDNLVVDIGAPPAATATPTLTSTPTAKRTNTPVPTPTAQPTVGGGSTGNCPCTIWPSTARPGGTFVDQPAELGVKFRADANGVISAIRFYKATGEMGAHTVHLWSRSGTLLGTASATGETASGWQQVNFASPIAITANTTYVASYHSNGVFGADLNGFTAAGVDAPPLHALRSGVDGPNGVYGYGASSVFPTSSFMDTNYWVDVVFSSGVAAGTTVTFNDLSSPGRPLTGQYPAGLIDWGTGAWYLAGPYGQFNSNSVGFNGAGPTSASFTFLSATRLLRVDAYNGGATASTVNISCPGRPTIAMILAPGQLATLPTGWSGACSPVTMSSSNGWATNFDNFVVQ